MDGGILKKKLALPFFTVLIISLLLNSVAIAAGSNDYYKWYNYLLPDSDKVQLTESSLFNLSIYDIDFARNEIFARHGYVFKTQKYADYFASKAWYKKNSNFKETMLTPLEKKNADFLRTYADKLKANFKPLTANSATLDLNSDGKKENIRITFNNEGSKFTLKVNNSTVSVEGCYFTGTVYLADINTKDKYKELAVVDAGPSDDYETYFYYYNGSRLVYMGKTPGGAYCMKINGSGNFITNSRGDVLQTWFYCDEFKLNSSHMVVNVPHKYYRMNTPVKMLKKLRLQKSPTDSSTATYVYSGEKVIIWETDDKKWCSIIGEKGQKGWFSVDSVSADYFEGLCFAD